MENNLDPEKLRNVSVLTVEDALCTFPIFPPVITSSAVQPSLTLVCVAHNTEYIVWLNTGACSEPQHALIFVPGLPLIS